jgi:hypothetical protein
MHRVLRTGAVICVILSVLTFLMALRGGSFSDRELIVSRKYTLESGSLTQFRLSSELPYPQRGYTYDTTVSRTFYDAAKTGDNLRSPLTGYLKLVREGGVVARYFSQEFVVRFVYAVVALLPVVAFLKLEHLPLPRLSLSVVGLIELVIIGAFLYGLFAPCC